jgi:hypothetical protein
MINNKSVGEEGVKLGVCKALPGLWLMAGRGRYLLYKAASASGYILPKVGLIGKRRVLKDLEGAVVA